MLKNLKLFNEEIHRRARNPKFWDVILATIGVVMLTLVVGVLITIESMRNGNGIQYSWILVITIEIFAGYALAYRING